MGHRANYIYINNKQIEIRFSSWGAQGDHVFNLLNEGVEKVIDFILNETHKDTVLMDDIWMEGAVLVDEDRKYALFWGGSTETLENIHNFYRNMKELRDKWEGWKLEYSYNGIESFYKYLKLPPPILMDVKYRRFNSGINSLYSDIVIWKQSINSFLTIDDGSGKKHKFLGFSLESILGNSWDNIRTIFIDNTSELKPISTELDYKNLITQLSLVITVNFPKREISFISLNTINDQLIALAKEKIWIGWEIIRLDVIDFVDVEGDL